jgi:hypothetical protein
MSSEDHNHTDTGFNNAAQAANEADTFKRDRDIAAKAVLDNMAKLKALRLARDAAAPPASVKKKSAKSSAKKTTAEKAPALAEWLAGRQNGGHRT